MSWKVLCCLLVAATTASVEAARVARQARSCPGGEDCIFMRNCRALQDVVAQQEPGYEDVIRNAICSSSSDIRQLKVCCPGTGLPVTPTPTPTTSPSGNGEDLIPKGKDCGQPPMFRVVFGKDAPLYAYSWMALLGYRDPANPKWSCGGALINDRYVLTAAHCVHRNFTVPVGNGDVVKVRLGEHNTATDPDCANSSVNVPCAPAPQDFTPEEVIVHPNFHQRAPVSDDIALIRLDRKVRKSISIEPVCLPSQQEDVKTFLGARDGIVAGWGATENATSSDVLQIAMVPFAEKLGCESHYPGQLVEEQVCFGGRGRVDSCFGDSGGPLFQASSTNLQYFILGIVSRGLPRCGIPGAPAVYTNVAFYRDWIAANIRP